MSFVVQRRRRILRVHSRPLVVPICAASAFRISTFSFSTFDIPSPAIGYCFSITTPNHRHLFPVTHAFDLAGRLTRRDYRLYANSPSGTISDSDVLTYDDAGRLATAVSGRYNNTVAYGDGAGRLTSESLTVTFGTTTTFTVGSQYDAAGRRTQITYPDNSVVTRSYTNRDQLYQLGYGTSTVSTFAYDDGGRRTTRTLGDTPGTVTTWTYGRSDNLPTSIADNRSIVAFGYTYDANKNKLTETLGSPMASYGFNSTTYDNEDRLTAWNRTDGNKAQSWSLSAAGDWNTFTENGTATTRTHNAAHELTAAGTTSLAYDAKGNLASYSWDFDNRMISNGWTYTYDALGRRVSKSIGMGTASSSSSSTDKKTVAKKAGTVTQVTTVFVNTVHPLEHAPQAGQEIAEYKNTGSGTAFTLQRKHVYGEYVDEPVLMANVGGTSETLYYYHANSLHSVAALTNQAGSVVERYSYTAYGSPTFHNADGTVATSQSSTVSNPFMYTGRRLDPETGLYYYRARYYNPALGRFISRDPIGYADCENLYAYVGNRPTISLDPSGKSFLSWVNGFGWTGDEADAFDQTFSEEAWDRTNGAMSGATAGYVDLSTVGYADRDSKTGKAYTFNEKSRNQNECFTACSLDTLVSNMVPTGFDLTPFQNAKDVMKQPGRSFQLGDVIEGFGSANTPLIFEGILEGVPGYPGVVESALGARGRKFYRNYINPAEKFPSLQLGKETKSFRVSEGNSFRLADDFSTRLRGLAVAATVVLYLNDLNNCRIKCFK